MLPPESEPDLLQARRLNVLPLEACRAHILLLLCTCLSREPPPHLHSRVNHTHPTQTVIFNRLTDFRLRVHHERSVARDWFVQRHTGDEQHFERSLRVRRVFDSHFVAVLREQNHLSISSVFALCSEQPLSLHHVSEGVV